MGFGFSSIAERRAMSCAGFFFVLFCCFVVGSMKNHLSNTDFSFFKPLVRVFLRVWMVVRVLS
jgi:predicted transporter